MKIGFVGIGQMGLPLCSNLLRAGFDVCAFDVSNDALDQAVAAGAKPAKSLAQLARHKDVIITALPSTKASREVIAGDNGIGPHLDTDAVVVEMSTVSPGLMRELAAQLARYGAHLLDCGMSGGPAGARSASLALMVGGDDHVLKRVRPALEAMSAHIVHCGDTGAGMAAKLVNNALAHVNALAVCEAFALGVSNGLEPKALYDVITNSSGNSWVLPERFGQYIETGQYKPGMKLDLLHKDSTLAMEMAHESGTPLFLMRIANSLFTTYKLEGMGDRNWAEMMTWWENKLGIRIGGHNN